jgi:hypothetical protein
MKNIFKFNEFINEEFVADYKFTKDEAGDKKHDRLASKEKDGHKWKRSGTTKEPKSMTKNFKCECGYKKTTSVDEKDKKTTVTYSK